MTFVHFHHYQKQLGRLLCSFGTAHRIAKGWPKTRQTWLALQPCRLEFGLERRFENHFVSLETKLVARRIACRPHLHKEAATDAHQEGAGSSDINVLFHCGSETISAELTDFALSIFEDSSQDH